MKNKFLLFAFVLTPFILAAQVGVGTTTVDSSAKFQVDATNKGFLQPRVSLTGISDATTIATPATGLMVFNTATAGSDADAVTPGVYYYSGTAWQRLADDTPVVASPQATTTIVSGDLGGAVYSSGSYMAFGQNNSSKSFGANITLPPGRWEVILNITAILQVQGGSGYESISSLEMSYWLQDNTDPDSSVGYGLPTIPTEITSDVLLPGGAMFTHPITLVNNSTTGNTYHKGSFFINNTGTTDKTYHLFYHEASFIGDVEINDHILIYYKAFGGNTWKSNRFYAVKID